MLIDALKTLSVLCPTSSFFFSEPYLNGSLCGETILSLLDLLDFCNLGFTHVSVMTNYLLDFSAFVSFTKIFNDHFKFQRAKQFNCTDIIVLCHSKAFVLDLFSLVYSLCAWVSLFLISMKSYYLSKKKS